MIVYITIVIKTVIFLAVMNVWLVRFNKSSTWRGGQALNMRQEFEVYGLSESVMYIVGGLKILAATVLLISIWLNQLTIFGAGAIAVLMLGAVSMHLKVRDPIIRAFPAFALFILSTFTIIFTLI